VFEHASKLKKDNYRYDLRNLFIAPKAPRIIPRTLKLFSEDRARSDRYVGSNRRKRR